MRKGCVSEGKREKIREAIINELKNLVDPTSGERPRVDAFSAEDIYFGPHLDEAPDIVFLVDDGRCEVDAKVGEGRLFVEGAPLTGWKGTHMKDGVFIARGPGIKSGLMIEKASIIDVAPTILHAFGIPLRDDMDGRIIEEIFQEVIQYVRKEPSEEHHDRKEEMAFLDDEEKALIEARLRKLGYIS